MFIKPYGTERRSNLPSPSGSEIENTYSYVIDKHGMKKLLQTGKKNVWEKIQEYLESTKIENVIARVTTGDTSMLRPNAIYTDISTAPKSMVEAMEQIHALEHTWNNLPNEIKDKYSTLENYVNEAGSEAWLKDMGYIENNITDQEIFEKATEMSTPNNDKGEE